MRKRQKKPGKREIRSISLKKQTEKNKKQKTGLTKEEKKRLKELRMIKAENQKKRKPFTAQDTIPYKEIYKDGIGRTDDNYYSKMVQFYDINYQLAQNDDKAAIFENYCEFLNSFDSSVEVQITFLNQQVNFDEYAKNIDIPEQDDCFNDIRKEYSDMLKMQLSKGNNGLVKTKYITFSIKADNLRNAKSRLERIEASVLNNFKVMGAMAEPLNGVERLKILHDVMNMDTKESFHFHYGMVAKTGLQTKDFIAPTGFDFRNDSYFRMGQTFGCVSYLQITSPELTDKLLADLLDLEENLIINMHLRPIDPKAAIKSLKSTLSNIQKMKIEEQKKAVRSGYDMDIIPTDISTYGEDVEGLLNEIQSRNEKLFELTFLLMNTADNKRKLDNIVYQTAGIAQKYNCNIRRLQYQQEQGLVASLPLGMNQTGIQRIMTTTSTAIFVPFTTQELFQGGEALYYGLNALSNNLIMVDRKRLKTPNGLILGTPGSGKSFATKREILNVFLITDDDIIICDPEGEYFPLVNALNGEVIKISAKSNDYINPMEVNLDVIYHPEKYRINGDVEDIDTIIADKAEFITSFCEVIMKKPQNAELNGDEVSMIDLCVKDIYTVMGQGGNDSYKYVRYKAGGKTYTVNAYCMQHSMQSPPSGTTYKNMVELDEGGDDKYLRKALFYGYGGPGWGHTFNGYNVKSIMEKYGCSSETRAMQHYLVDYLYDGESGFGGALSTTAKNMLKEIKAALAKMPDPTAMKLLPGLSVNATGKETESFTWKANEAFTITIHLENGVSLVNETTGKTASGNVTVSKTYRRTVRGDL